MKSRRERGAPSPIVGLIPAAGKGSRMAPLPGSKELLPIGVVADAATGRLRPRVACESLLEQMAAAGVSKAMMVIGAGKWDIPAYLQSRAAGVDLAYVVAPQSPNTPSSLDAAYPFIAEQTVAMGFPDIIFSEPKSYAQILRELRRASADVVLGLFPAAHPQSQDLVECDEDGRVRRIVIKPKRTRLTQTWGVAVWTPAFSAYMHDFLRRRRRGNAGKELFVGDVIQAAIDDGLHVRGQRVSMLPYLDVGTPQTLLEAWRRQHASE